MLTLLTLPAQCDCPLSIHNFPKRTQGQAGELQVLNGEGNANDGNGAKQAKEEVGESNPQSCNDDPEYVQQQGQTTRGAACRPSTTPKRKQAERRELEALNAKRNANDGEAQDHTSKEIFEGYGDASTQENPQYVAQ
jgi:hypothetical protein